MYQPNSHVMSERYVNQYEMLEALRRDATAADMAPSNREPVLTVPDVRMTVCDDFVEGRQRLGALDVIIRQHLSVLLFRWNRSVRNTQTPCLGNQYRSCSAFGRRSMPIDELQRLGRRSIPRIWALFLGFDRGAIACG